MDQETAPPEAARPADDPVVPVEPAGPPAWWARLAGRWDGDEDDDGEAGMSTAEYAVGTVAACAFAAVLYQVVTGGSVVAALGALVDRALATLS
jgi:Protein of unknown function (DUF4244)